MIINRKIYRKTLAIELPGIFFPVKQNAAGNGISVYRSTIQTAFFAFYQKQNKNKQTNMTLYFHYFVGLAIKEEFKISQERNSRNIIELHVIA